MIPVMMSKKSDDRSLSEVDVEPGQIQEDVVRPMHPLVWRLMLLTGVLVYGSYTIMVHLCEVDGKIPFSSASMVLVIEILKLAISITMFMPEVKTKGFEMPPVSYVIPFAIPALLYCINNNLAVQMQTQMDPATYQVLGNMKILSTASLYRLILKRPITGVQWLALLFLLSAGICNSYGGLQAKPGTSSAGIVHITLKGLIMISTYCFLSGLSGVYSEYILKRKYETSLHLQNILLYMFGILLNGFLWLHGALSSDDPNSFNLLNGYTFLTYVLVLTQAFNGLIMSAIFKHGNNITRLFIISIAMLVTTILSMLIFNLQLNLYFCSSFILVTIALLLYHRS